MIKTSLSHLIENSYRSIDAYSANEKPSYSDDVGFHIYADLRLTLKLLAASEEDDAQRYLSLLQIYALLADTCANIYDTQLLEVQGHRIHLFMPAEDPQASIHRLLTFAFSFTQLVYENIKQNEDEQVSFAMSADYGRSIFISTGSGADGSIVSLGPAANAPAKRIGKTPAGHISLPSAILRNLSLPRNISTWTDISLVDVKSEFEQFVDGALTDIFRYQVKQLLMEQRKKTMPAIRTVDAAFFEDAKHASVDSPLKVAGFCMRADLDGFTNDVKRAFDSGEHAIQKLVQRFTSIMSYAQAFVDNVTEPVIRLPWAGDCANQVILPQVGDSYDDARGYIPAKLPGIWHEQAQQRNSNQTPWADLLGDNRWAVGLAGGNPDTDEGGAILIASISTRNREFLIMAGWGVGRSLNALDADGVKADDTVITKADRSGLDSPLQKFFKELNTRFWISSNLTESKVNKACIEAASLPAPVYVSTAGKSIPSPKPYWLNDV